MARSDRCRSSGGWPWGADLLVLAYHRRWRAGRGTDEPAGSTVDERGRYRVDDARPRRILSLRQP